MKIQIQITPPSTNKQQENTNARVTSQSKRREKNCTRRYLIGLRSQNGEHFVNIFESNILDAKVN